MFKAIVHLQIFFASNFIFWLVMTSDRSLGSHESQTLQNLNRIPVRAKKPSILAHFNFKFNLLGKPPPQIDAELIWALPVSRGGFLEIFKLQRETIWFLSKLVNVCILGKQIYLGKIRVPWIQGNKQIWIKSVSVSVQNTDNQFPKGSGLGTWL